MSNDYLIILRLKNFVNSLHRHDFLNPRDTIFQFCLFLCNMTYKKVLKEHYTRSFTAFLYIFNKFLRFINVIDLPVDRFHAVCLEKFVCLTEMPAPKKSVICR